MPAENRTEHIVVRVTPAEKKEVESAAEIARQKASEWTREKLLRAARNDRRKAAA